MKTILSYRKRLTVAVCLSALLVSSCSIMEETPITTSQRQAWTIQEHAATKSGPLIDSLQYLISFQTNKRIILMHQIKKRNGAYYLDLTQTDIESLSIPDSLHQWALNYVKCLNDYPN